MRCETDVHLSKGYKANFTQLLRDLRDLRNPHQETQIGVPELDHLLNIFQSSQRSHLPTAAARLEPPREQVPVSPRGTGLPTGPPPQTRKKPIVEVTGRSGSGKTHLLYYVASVAALPVEWHGIKLGGKGGAVAIVDSDGRFSVSRLAEVMECLIQDAARKQSLPQAGADEVSTLVHDCLTHVLIFRPQSSAALQATLSSLPALLLDGRGHHSSHRHLETLLVDSASAFAWQTRQAAEADNEEAHDRDIAALRHISGVESTVQALRDVQGLLSCSLLFTTWALNPLFPTPGRAATAYRPHLLPPWGNLATLRLIVDRVNIVKFAPGMSVEEALRDADKRQEAVEKGQVHVIVNQWGSEEWSDGIKKALSADSSGGGFDFRITQAGITIGSRGLVDDDA